MSDQNSGICARGLYKISKTSNYVSPIIKLLFARGGIYAIIAKPMSQELHPLWRPLFGAVTPRAVPLASSPGIPKPTLVLGESLWNLWVDLPKSKESFPLDFSRLHD